MIASVHVADVDTRTSLALLARPPKAKDVVGLRQADVGLAARLSGAFVNRPSLSRVGLIAFWDDDDALDAFLANDARAAQVAGGFHVRLDPLRAHGSWPGLPADLPSVRAVDHDGPVAALTLGRLRLTQAVRFLKTSARAEAEVLEAPGLIWTTGIGRPPLVSSFSLWESTKALSTYAYGRSTPAHPDAIDAGHAEPFHKREAFIRFRPYGFSGRLEGENPLAEQAEPAV